jgi:hypothetical protein
MLKQRQISISATKQSSIAVKDLKEMAPKIGVLVREIERAKKAKHIVYSSFVGSGLHIVAEALEARGWINVREIYRDPEMWSEYSGKVFAVWDGKTKDTEKQWIKGVANSKENMYGVKIRVILGSPSMKEGVSFKHIQHMHLLDPMWNQSARMQVEGRAIRFCSHVDMPADKRTVNVHTYKIVPREGGLVESTCDQIIYDIIIPRKQAMVEAGEAALKLNALDYKLFKRLYKVPSKAEAEVMKNIVIHKHRNAKTSCPRKRRPFLDTCPNGNHLKKNPKGDDCCYKDAKVRAKKQRDAATTCPKVRRPDEEGNCKAGFMSRKNNHGDDCCYKNK